MAEYRFPKPDFQTPYNYPELLLPSADSWVWPYIDIFMLVLFLGLSVFLIYRKRSRKAILLTGAFALLYFGFFRAGCICPIGSIQSVSEALFLSGSVITISTLALFFLPLISSLIWGRTYCGSVCPMGAIQELVSIKKIPLPKWVSKPLALFPPIFLFLSVLGSATGSDLLICRFDPFIPIFRLSGTPSQIILSLSVIVTAMLIYRPYCRFICPYGFLLKITSMVSAKSFKITDKGCVNCSICSEACPADVVEKPDIKESSSNLRKTAIIIILLIPVFMTAGAFLGSGVSPLISRLNRDVQLLNLLDTNQLDNQEVEAFMISVESEEELRNRVTEVKRNFRIYSIFGGLILGLLYGIALLTILRQNKLNYHQPNRGECYNCGNCFHNCPVEIKGGKNDV